ncbi:MAG: hypothetical protein M1822_005768 [Bathelium mastoideum]|nr:MAG: hypothetical protein M1822_005768 [Bathelium mastoideum]
MALNVSLAYLIVYDQDAFTDIAPMVYVHDLSSNGSRIKPSGSSESSKPSLRLLGKSAGATLLSDGDQVFLSPQLSFTFRANPSVAVQEGSRDPDHIREKKAFQSQYLIASRKLGAGAYGSVYVAVEPSTGRQLACKHIDLRRKGRAAVRPDSNPASDNGRLLEEQRKLRNLQAKQRREFEVLKDLSHVCSSLRLCTIPSTDEEQPNIIQLIKVFSGSKSLYIFQELITGGDLYSYIDFKGGRLLDAEAGLVIRQILKAITYLHDLNIVHRDLKPDNILMTSLSTGARVILTDFGNARYLPNSNDEPTQMSLKQRMFSVVGTYEYVAPEVYRRNKTIDAQSGYSQAVDMWSIGAIACALLTGDVMFINRKDPEYGTNPGNVILTLAEQCNLDAMNKETIWEDVGHRAKDFIRKLLVLDENQRLTASQALQHRWFSNRRHRLLFESVYEKSIRQWKPRGKIPDLVEDLDALMEKAKVESAAEKDISNAPSRSISRHLPPHQIQQVHAPEYNGRDHALSTIPEMPEEDADAEKVETQREDIQVSESLQKSLESCAGVEEPEEDLSPSETTPNSANLPVPDSFRSQPETDALSHPHELSFALPAG